MARGLRCLASGNVSGVHVCSVCLLLLLNTYRVSSTVLLILVICSRMSVPYSVSMS